MTVDEFIKITSLFVSWPVAVTIITLVFFLRFRESIDHFLRHLRSVTFPGGSVETQPKPTSSEKVSPELTAGTAFVQWIKELQLREQNVSQTNEQLKEQLTEVSRRSYQWKFDFLNQFLVLTTKKVLHWFAKNLDAYSISRDSFHQLWQQQIPDTQQRDIIIGVLLGYNMLLNDEMSLKITREGYIFLQYIGFIPYVPPTGSNV